MKSRSRALTRLTMGLTTRLTAAAVLASVGLTATATQAPAPMAAHLQEDAAAGSAGDDALVTVIKQASVSSRGSSLLEVAPGLDVPAPALRAYRFAEAVMRTADPACRLDWSLLAAIGDVESDHGRYGGAEVRPDGSSTPHILGPQLDGGGDVAAITDTDNGNLDGDRRWDRAVGPMQFIPSTWSAVGADADGDEVRNPHDIDDAALAAAAYLCAGDADLSTTAGQKEAVYRYNHSASYVALVLRLAAAYADDAFALAAPQPDVRPSSRRVEVPTLARPIRLGAHPTQSPARSLGVHGPAGLFAPAPGRDRRPTGPVGVAGAASGSSSPTSTADGTVSSPSSSPGGTGDGTVSGTDGGDKVQTSGGTRDGGGETDAEGSGDTDTRDFQSGSTAPSGDGDSGDGDSRGSTGDGTASGSTDGRASDDTSDDDTTKDDTTKDGTSNDGTSNDAQQSDGSGGTDDSTQQDSSDPLSGKLTRDDGTWFVAGTAVSFGDDAYLNAKALHDFDGVDGVESNLGELETLVDDEVSVVLEGDVVHELNGMAYR